MRQTTINLLILLVCCVLAAWFLYTHEKVTETEYVGYSGEARYNDFLAAELLLQNAGIDSDARASLTPTEWLPDYSDTIVTKLSASIAVGDEQLELLDWIAGGGHLVLLPPTDSSDITDGFLRLLGAAIFAIEIDEDEADDEPAADGDTADEDEEDYDYIVDLDSTWQRIELLEAASFGATLSDDHGVILARRGWGDGTISILSDDSYFLNGSLDDFDHARLLLDTVAGYIDPGTVWFVLDAAFPSLWEVLWRELPLLVIAAIATLLLCLWSAMPRFGPAMQAPSADRRSILEHVAASGHFAWRHHGTSKLADSSVRAILHEAELRHPGLGRLPVAAQARHLSQLTGVPAQTILDLLVSRDDTRHREFTHSVQTLQRMRKLL